MPVSVYDWIVAEVVPSYTLSLTDNESVMGLGKIAEVAVGCDIM
jgi:hypothetical protein